jgi:hypothetical protein
MHVRMILVAVGLIGLPTAAYATNAKVEAPIHQFIDSFDKGDAAGAGAANDPAGVTIIDDVAPHLWSGPKAFETWAADLDKADKARGRTEQKVTLTGAPYEIIDTDTAYVVWRAIYSFKDQGAAMTESAKMTYALKKSAGGWKITGWTWAGSPKRPAK